MKVAVVGGGSTCTPELVDGAVLLQLRVGGQAARHQDETWPLECGCVGQETTGAGGLAKALRTVPVVLDIAERARRRAGPGAWIMGVTNPAGIVTRALLDVAGHGAEIAEHTGLPASVLDDVAAVPSYCLPYFWAHDAAVREERG